MDRFEPDPALLERLGRLEPRSWSGILWRHTLGSNPPERTNLRGARWNPPGVEALYTSLDRSTAVAEGDHLVASQPVRLRAKRNVYQLEVNLKALLDLTDPALLASLGVEDEALKGDDYASCQAVGGAAWFLHFDGIIVPSARSPGHNVVILFENPDDAPEIQVRHSEVLGD